MADENKLGGVLAMTRLKEGVTARGDGADSLDCPYSRNGDQAERFSAHWWTKGWLQAAPETEGAAAS